MTQLRSFDYDLPENIDHPVRAAGQDRQGIRVGLAITGASLGSTVGLLAVVAAGLSVDNPVGWLAVACCAAIGAVLGA